MVEQRFNRLEFLRNHSCRRTYTTYHNVGNSEKVPQKKSFAGVRQFSRASLILPMKTGALPVCFAGAHGEENAAG